MKKEPKRKRSIPKLVRFTKEEAAYIQNKIAQSPYNNFQNFARIMLITGEIVHVDYSELRKLNIEVARIGNNVNQMARLANQFQEISSEDVRDLLEEVKNLQSLTSSALKKEMQRGK
ncbi:plasmid mobilization relaxosome protein MobC [Enterococcus faecium]|nr:plasmid mobilization relaxosome protein MobC [Enterococcus faecium]